MITVKKYLKNPVILPSLDYKDKSREISVYNPGAVVKGKKVFLFYRSDTYLKGKITSTINLAVSNDGLRFINKGVVIKPTTKTEKIGCEDPRIVKIDKQYLLTYTGYSGKDSKGKVKVALCGAVSRDLLKWKKIGVLIKNDKSGGVVQNYKHKDNYVMYFGGDKIQLAFSEDLKNWKTDKKAVLKNRGGDYFDSHLVEVGPPPVLIDEGILVIYNGHKYNKFCTGVAIFDKKNPSKLIKRYEKPILEPKEYWEKFGTANNIVFSTSLIKFAGKWLLYYGGADKAIGVATLSLKR
jgi:predicted GH43/DUF377 family glycosyl hydrolase